MRRQSALFISLVATILAASACSGRTPDGAAHQGAPAHYAVDGTFTMAISAEFATFDPYHANLFGYSALAYDSLVNLRPDGQFVSGLAASWTADTHSATFVLRPNVTCSDGTPLAASQVARDLAYLGDPKNQSIQYGVFIPTVPYTVTSDDTSRTVRVVMSKPFGFLLNMIGQAPIVCDRGLKDPKALTTASDGTGPFVLTKVVAGQSYTFTVRKDYRWGPGGVGTDAGGTPAKIVLRVVSNETTSANLMLSGDVNFAQIRGVDRQRLSAAGLARVAVPELGATLAFNHLDGRPTSDERVRRALATAMDLDQLVKVSTGGTGTAGTGLVVMQPKVCSGDTAAGHLPRHDNAAAQALLDQDGWTKGADGTRSKNGRQLSIDIHYIPSFGAGFVEPTVELLAQEWKSIGVRVTLHADTNAAYSQAIYQTRNWDVALLMGGGAYLPSQFVPYLSGPTPPKGVNGYGIDNKTYDLLVAKAQALVPPAACAYWNQAEQALFRDVDEIPISNFSSFYYLKSAQAQAAGFNIPIPTSIKVLG